MCIFFCALLRQSTVPSLDRDEELCSICADTEPEKRNEQGKGISKMEKNREMEEYSA